MRRFFLDDTDPKNMGSGHKTVGPSIIISMSVNVRYAIENEGLNHRPVDQAFPSPRAPLLRHATKHVRSGPTTGIRALTRLILTSDQARHVL